MSGSELPVISIVHPPPAASTAAVGVRAGPSARSTSAPSRAAASCRRQHEDPEVGQRAEVEGAGLLLGGDGHPGVAGKSRLSVVC